MQNNIEKLKNYLSDVYQMEIKKYIAQNTMKKLKDDIKKKESDYKAEFQDNYVENDVIRKKIFAPIILICAILVTMISIQFIGREVFTAQEKAGEYSGTSSDSSVYDGQHLLVNPTSEEIDAYMSNSALKELEKIKKLYNFFKFIEYVLIILLLFCCINIWLSYKKRKEEKEKADIRNKNLAERTKNKISILNKNYYTIQEAEREIEKTLEQLYSLNIIYPKYRYLEACGMFLEYLMSGRAQALEATPGFAGAYNLFEEELFRGEIKNKLNEITQNQKILIQGQRNIITGMNTIIAGIDDLCQKADNTQKSIGKMTKAVETNNFYNSVIAYNTTISRKIMENYYY